MSAKKLAAQAKASAAASAALAAEQAAAETAAAAEDVLECGSCVDVFYPAVGKRASTDGGVSSQGEWRVGTVVRAHIGNPAGAPAPAGGKNSTAAAYPSHVVYDVMIRGGVEEKCLARSRLRLVCATCLADKRTFKPPPMYCEKCLAGIHQRWRYWDEAREDETPSVKLCNRCFNDVRASPESAVIMHELVGRAVDLSIFVERKEKDRPEFVDNWVQCEECHSWHHWVCALFKGEDTPEDTEWFCESCRKNRNKQLPDELVVPHATALPETELSKTLEKSVASALSDGSISCNPVTVRVVSNIENTNKVNETLRLSHVRSGDEAGGGGGEGASAYPEEFPYRSKCVLAFQERKGHPICFFAMYVQEYGSECPPPNTNRVYISYLDSVRYFESQPEGKRTLVYHAILVGYLEHVKRLGFTHAHIWVSPPKQGDDYIFYGHPDEMVNKRMGLLKLKQWYEQMLNIAKGKGIVADYQDMLEEFKGLESVSEIPLFSGDHWATSIHNKLKEESKKQLSKQPSSSGAKPPKASKQSSMNDMVEQLTEEMKSMRNHFIVVTLHAEHVGVGSNNCKPPTPDQRIHDPDPLMSNELIDSRATFLEKCQVFHWQFNEVPNAQHSTMMLLHYLHNRHRSKPAAPGDKSKRTGASGSLSEMARIHRSRTQKIESAMRDWSQLLRHAEQATKSETWELPPEELFGRILSQINRSKRDILHDKYNQCKQPTTSVMARSVFIRVLKRIAESFISCLLNMQSNPSLQA